MGLFRRLFGKRDTGSEPNNSGRIFLDHEGLARVRRLRQEGKLDDAEAMLVRAEPSAAVLDELRLISSKRARSAKKQSDWAAVVQHLESYMEFAEQHRDECIRLVNQEPPEHTESDQRLLKEVRAHLGD